GQRHRPSGLEPLRSGASVRADRWRYFSRRVDARSAVLGAPRGRLCRLSGTVEGTLPLRIGRASGRRRHRSSRSQCCACDRRRSALAVLVFALIVGDETGCLHDRGPPRQIRFTVAANCASVWNAVVLPTLARFSIICEDFTASAMTAFSASTMSAGVFTGTNMPSHESTTTL